jgi:hypothetical protein
MVGSASAKVAQLVNDNKPAKRKSWKIFKRTLPLVAAFLIIGPALKPTTRLLAEPAPFTLAQITDKKEQKAELTAEQVKAWFSKATDCKSAPFGKESIKIVTGSSSLDIGGKKLDISAVLAKMGLQSLSADAKIVFGGPDAPFQTYFITDAKAKGVLKLFISSAGAVATTDKMANDAISIPSGFALAASSNSVATALCGPKLIVFDFGNRKMVSMDLESMIEEKNPSNLKLVGNAQGESEYLALTADNFKNMYLINLTEFIQTRQTSMQKFQKDGK